ncbi:MAG: hypothetical protein R3F19_23310 [Verrucomicrobiales bacterium]
MSEAGELPAKARQKSELIPSEQYFRKKKQNINSSMSVTYVESRRLVEENLPQRLDDEWKGATITTGPETLSATSM